MAKAVQLKVWSFLGNQYLLFIWQVLNAFLGLQINIYDSPRYYICDAWLHKTL